MPTDRPSESNPWGLLRIDLQQSLRQSEVDPRRLSPFQRILLTTDGTVTEILEAQYLEAIQIVKLFTDDTTTHGPIPYLDIGPSIRTLIRKVLLRGKYSHKNYIYAESIIVPDRLDERLREGLLTTKKPIGQLILEDRLETFREILTCRMEPAAEIGEYFAIPPDALLISRVYRVFAGHHPIMLITEKFPETAFKD